MEVIRIKVIAVGALHWVHCSCYVWLEHLGLTQEHKIWGISGEGILKSINTVLETFAVPGQGCKLLTI